MLLKFVLKFKMSFLKCTNLFRNPQIQIWKSVYAIKIGRIRFWNMKISSKSVDFLNQNVHKFQAYRQVWSFGWRAIERGWEISVLWRNQEFDFVSLLLSWTNLGYQPSCHSHRGTLPGGDGLMEATAPNQYDSPPTKPKIQSHSLSSQKLT